VTVPEGNTVAGFDEVMYAITSIEPPAVGVSVEGEMEIAVGLFDTVRVIVCEVELA
jgi:hypothetical protein